MTAKTVPRIVIIGGGHAGVEAACAAAAVGCSAILITPVSSKIAMMSCNPSIGGIAKGTLVRELDALGGVSAFSADRTTLQFRMLNMKKGPAVWGPRAQTDVWRYCAEQKRRLEEAGVEIVEDLVVSFKGPTDRIDAVVTQQGKTVKGDCFVLAAGTFLKGILHRGARSWPGGRRGDISAVELERDLRNRMFHVKRFKTGTSPRILRNSVNTELMKIQETHHDMDFNFSWRSENPVKSIEKCWVTRTTRRTEDLVRNSLEHSPLYAGRISGKGPRYCPSFEDKVTKFSERTGHPIHLEPVGRGSRIMYMNGFSTSLPEHIQEEIVRTVPGFENAIIAAYGYSVEYTCFETGEFMGTMRMQKSQNLYAAGQILGTSGYEEAAATGLLAGTNAARRALDLKEIVPERMNSYLGVMVDDLVTRGAEEPYRLFSSRSENRLHLRQDNADRRVFQLGISMGTTSDASQAAFRERMYSSNLMEKRMGKIRIEGKSLSEICLRPEVTTDWVAEKLGVTDGSERKTLRSLVLDMKYGGYIKRAKRKFETRDRYRQAGIGEIRDYLEVQSISTEAALALNVSKPGTLGEAEKLPAVRQSDMDALILHVMKGNVSRET